MHHWRRRRDLIGTEFGGFAEWERGGGEGVCRRFFGFDELAGGGGEGGYAFAVAEEEVEEEDAEDAGEDVRYCAVAPDRSWDGHGGGVVWEVEALGHCLLVRCASRCWQLCWCEAHCIAMRNA